MNILYSFVKTPNSREYDCYVHVRPNKNIDRFRLGPHSFIFIHKKSYHEEFVDHAYIAHQFTSHNTGNVRRIP